MSARTDEKCLKCPHCGSQGPFDVRMLAWFDVRWNNKSMCYDIEDKGNLLDDDGMLKRDYMIWCAGCSALGLLKDFGGRDFPESVKEWKSTGSP